MTSVFDGEPTTNWDGRKPFAAVDQSTVVKTHYQLKPGTWLFPNNMLHIFSFSWHEKFPKSRDFSSVHQKISPAPHNIQSDVVLSRERLPKLHEVRCSAVLKCCDTGVCANGPFAHPGVGCWVRPPQSQEC